MTGATGATGATGTLPVPATLNDNTQANTNNTTYGAPDTGTAVAVTLTTGTRALVIVTGQVEPGGGETAYLSFAVSGATTQVATDARAVIRGASPIQASTTTLITNLTAGTNTFTLQYKSNGSTVGFTNRTISVIPLN